MASILRLALLLALLATVAGLQLVRPGLGTPVALAAGSLLLAGLFAGKLVAAFGLPRLTGYLLIGIAVGPYGLGFIPTQGMLGLDLVRGAAVALIALAAGAELQVSLLRRVGRKALVLASWISLAVGALVMTTLMLVRPWVGFFANMELGLAMAVAAMVSAVVISFSPTVTLAIVQETRAKGPLTEFLMAIVVIGDLLVMVVFAMATALVRTAEGGAFDLGTLVGGVGWELGGSAAVGAAVGFGALLYLRRVGKELSIFIVALCVALAESGSHLHLSPLLMGLMAGALIANLDPTQGARLAHSAERAGLPVFALFFALAGAALHLDVLVDVGLVAILLVLVRGSGIYWACRVKAPDGDPKLRRFLWMGLISQAGVTFGLAALVARSFPGFGPAAEVMIIAMIIIHELVGPVLTRRALAKAGEIPLLRGPPLSAKAH